MYEKNAAIAALQLAIKLIKMDEIKILDFTYNSGECDVIIIRTTDRTKNEN